MTNENIVIDCIAMKREAQANIYEDIKGMSHEEEIKYFRNAVASSRFKDWWNEIGTKKSLTADYEPAAQ